MVHGCFNLLQLCAWPGCLKLIVCILRHCCNRPWLTLSQNLCHSWCHASTCVVPYLTSSGRYLFHLTILILIAMHWFHQSILCGCWSDSSRARQFTLDVSMQVVVHNLPWSCTWQVLKDHFADCPGLERADVIIDNDGRSRWACVSDFKFSCKAG